MSLTNDYEAERMMIERGYRCDGDDCNGWKLTDFDTWEKCGCGAASKRPCEHPEMDAEQPLHGEGCGCKSQ